jgi:4-amino-4-deoxy-L-arabinose transferase-like glycosyltransferase
VHIPPDARKRPAARLSPSGYLHAAWLRYRFAGQADPWLLLAALVAFVVIWGLYAAISDGPVAIHQDMSEAYVWGREFQLGYNQHPPFWAWIAGAWFSLMPRTTWAFDLLAILNAAIGLLGAWWLIGDFTSGARRIAATTLLLLTPFYTFLSLKYNANSIFLSLWPWTLHVFMRSLDERRMSDAIWFGVLMGAAMLSKYYAVVLGMSCLLAAVLHPERRRYFTSPAPYVSLAVGLLVFSPHVWWLFHNNFRSVHYATGLAAAHHISQQDWIDPIRYALGTVGACIAYQAAVLVLIVAVSRTGPRAWITASRARWRDPRFRILLALAFSPLAFTVLFGLVFHLKISSNMTIGVFSLAPLALIGLIGVRDEGRLARRSVQAAVVFSLAALILSPLIAYATIRISKDPRVVLPQIELARAATQVWRERTGRPLLYVAGENLYPGAVAFYSPDRPHSFIHFDLGQAPWVTPALLAQHGLLAVCQSDDAECLAAATRFSTSATVKVPLTLSHSFWGYSRAPRSFMLFLTPPQAGQAGSAPTRTVRVSAARAS